MRRQLTQVGWTPSTLGSAGMCVHVCVAVWVTPLLPQSFLSLIKYPVGYLWEPICPRVTESVFQCKHADWAQSGQPARRCIWGDNAPSIIFTIKSPCYLLFGSPLVNLTIVFFIIRSVVWFVEWKQIVQNFDWHQMMTPPLFPFVHKSKIICFLSLAQRNKNSDMELNCHYRCTVFHLLRCVYFSGGFNSYILG